MKQINSATVTKLALRNKSALFRETRYAMADWLKSNAYTVADIETGHIHKTFYGQWSNGWKAEMKRSSIERAKETLEAEFLSRNCKILNGAIWLCDWDLMLETKDTA